ncbi:MAG: hypothetical protein EU516_01310 [Promethearchaeota archaeon]|nr:MAG: hypothetical protein EU516_01310 [Candidatus Lokiarchaeota archaeon]
MNNLDSEKLEKDHLLSGKGYLFQIDFLKAAMIFLVIFDHFVAWSIKSEIAASLWERISIPIFLVIIGFNMGLSFQREGASTLKELYSWKYFKKKIFRYLVPFLILYAASTFIGLFMYGFDPEAMYYGQFYPEHGPINYFIGYLPFWGPGNWFLPVIFGSILLLPLLYWVFTKSKILALVSCFVIEFIMQVITFFLIGDITSWEELHIYNIIVTSVVFNLSGIGLGMWFSFGYKLTSKRNAFMWILFPISLIYIIFYQFFDLRIEIDGTRFLMGDYHFLFIPYSAFLVLLALQFIPNKSNLRISKGIKSISRATYHILLTQILGFGMITAWWGTHYGMDLPFNPFDIIDLILLWILFIGFGTLWYKIDLLKNLPRRILYYINFFVVFPCLLFLSFWMQGLWIPLPLIVIILYALAALMIHYVIKEPLPTKVLSVWTLLIFISFILMVLQIELLSASLHWILNVPIGIYIVFAVLYTGYYYK